MHAVPRAVWALVAWIAYLGPIADGAGVVDIGLVYPLANETYEPTDRFPVVFAIQNPELARNLDTYIWFKFENHSDPSVFSWDLITRGSFLLRPSNFTDHGSEPMLLWTHQKIDGEGPVWMWWAPAWYECDETGAKVDSKWIGNRTAGNFLTKFEVRRGGRKADLVAATARDDDEECAGQGVTINVTDRTHEVSRFGEPGPVTCAVVDLSSPTPASNPCRVTIDQAAVESKEAADLEERCRNLTGNKPPECPDENLAAWKLGVPGFTSLAAALGAAAFLVICQIR
ncbi:hypothetical protein CPLU01_04366 [Colletotrichum plurivorum]|uniref:DUF7136 domain-containing protein n=1 Tax=Colletotrichum plurivorum TaxID=2175906 RepID=A0A8H6KQV0_9PEZI|nr:hypothetical protein CPLU01_04366 [Colletotrichum plurivorum]